MLRSSPTPTSPSSRHDNQAVALGAMLSTSDRFRLFEKEPDDRAACTARPRRQLGIRTLTPVEVPRPLASTSYTAVPVDGGLTRGPAAGCVASHYNTALRQTRSRSAALPIRSPRRRTILTTTAGAAASPSGRELQRPTAIEQGVYAKTVAALAERLAGSSR